MDSLYRRICFCYCIFYFFHDLGRFSRNIRITFEGTPWCSLQSEAALNLDVIQWPRYTLQYLKLFIGSYFLCTKCANKVLEASFSLHQWIDSSDLDECGVFPKGSWFHEPSLIIPKTFCYRWTQAVGFTLPRLLFHVRNRCLRMWSCSKNTINCSLTLDTDCMLSPWYC
jgi:hypothetical protein